MYAATRGPNMKWGAQISNGVSGTSVPPPAGDGPASDPAQQPWSYARLGDKVLAIINNQQSHHKTRANNTN